MRRKLFFASSIFALVVVASAGLASALTIEELQARMQALFREVATLRATSAVRSPNPVASSPSNPAGNVRHRVCALLARDLSQGSRGDDVRSLQEFLRAEGHLGAEATGYFGALTRDAVARWQASQGISAVGSVGPVSREHIKVWCGLGGNTERFTASPSRGEAPLSVVFSTWLSSFRPTSIYYIIDFGDGTSERAADCLAPADACISPGQNTHTYAHNGTYTATLNKVTDPCQGQPACLAPIQSEVVAKAQVHIGATACTKEYRPVCASKPIVCITTPCNPIVRTYGNRCLMEADGASFLSEGQCRADSNRPPVISSFSGPTVLAINETGTWTVHASDPENGSLSYHVVWGDEVYAAPMGAVAAKAFVQTTTFTHAYARAGTYTVIIHVRDSAGLQAQTTTRVRVEGSPIYCTMEYAPVCGQPPEPACRRIPPYCMLPTPGPQTYSNRCMLDAAGAAFLYEGRCRNEPVACTMDALQCPDGTWVGRSGPNCEFKCPGY